jgi:hypothetical protein
MKRSLLFIGFLLILSIFISDKQQKARPKILRDLKYLLYLPREYGNENNVHWPLILFLHGAGEIGNNLEKVKENGPPKLIAEGKEFPFIIVSPQLPYFEFWNPDQLVKMLRDIIHNYRVDEERIYLTGMSMGGYGTWMTAMRYPELFAAIVPICGGGDPSSLWKIRHTPVWIFHGARDPRIPLASSINMASRLVQYDNMKITIYPNAEHDSWTATYNNDELYKWLLEHKRFRFSLSGLKGMAEDYTGLFSSGKDTVRIFQAEGKLKIRPGIGFSAESVLLPGRDNSFFFNENSLSEIKYKFDQNSKMIYFMFYNDLPKAYFRVR